MYDSTKDSCHTLFGSSNTKPLITLTALLKQLFIELTSNVSRRDIDHDEIEILQNKYAKLLRIQQMHSLQRSRLSLIRNELNQAGFTAKQLAIVKDALYFNLTLDDVEQNDLINNIHHESKHQSKRIVNGTIREFFTTTRPYTTRIENGNRLKYTLEDAINDDKLWIESIQNAKRSVNDDHKNFHVFDLNSKPIKTHFR